MRSRSVRNACWSVSHRSSAGHALNSASCVTSTRGSRSASLLRVVSSRAWVSAPISRSESGGQLRAAAPPGARACRRRAARAPDAARRRRAARRARLARLQAVIACSAHQPDRVLDRIEPALRIAERLVFGELSFLSSLAAPIEQPQRVGEQRQRFLALDVAAIVRQALLDHDPATAAGPSISRGTDQAASRHGKVS